MGPLSDPQRIQYGNIGGPITGPFWNQLWAHIWAHIGPVGRTMGTLWAHYGTHREQHNWPSRFASNPPTLWVKRRVLNKAYKSL